MQLRRGMLGEMFCGFARVVIVRRAVFIVVMADAFEMVDLVRNVEHFLERGRAILHCKSMQGQQQHQENAEKATHGEAWQMQCGRL